jgi:hypothetical protein
MVDVNYRICKNHKHKRIGGVELERHKLPSTSIEARLEITFERLDMRLNAQISAGWIFLFLLFNLTLDLLPGKTIPLMPIFYHRLSFRQGDQLIN